MKLTRILVLLLLPCVSFSPLVRASEPWDVPFVGNPKAILEAAKGIPVPESQPVVVLLEEHRIVVYESGRITSKVRKVFRLANEDALEEWASVEQEFQPWHEAKPELRARVIGTDGVEHWLEAKTIADSPAEEFDQTIFSDRRVIRAPLPAVAVGAVVEYEITVRETAPLLDTGESRRIVIYDELPIQRFKLSLSAAKNIPLQGDQQIDPCVRNSPERSGGMGVRIGARWRSERTLNRVCPSIYLTSRMWPFRPVSHGNKLPRATKLSLTNKLKRVT